MRRRRHNILTRIIYNPKFLAFLGLVILILISIPLAKNVSKRYNINKEVRELGKEIEELEYKNKDLKDLIIYLESDQFVEEQARLNLGLKKEGEQAIVIEDISPRQLLDSGEENSGELASAKNLTNPQKWWRYFFN